MTESGKAGLKIPLFQLLPENRIVRRERLGTDDRNSRLRLGECQVDGMGCAGVDADVLGDVRITLREIESEVTVV